MAGNRLLLAVEVLIQQEHRVIGQLVLAQAGEAAQIGEQHDNRSLDAEGLRVQFADAVHGLVCRDQRGDRELADWFQLTGETDTVRCLDLVQQLVFHLAGWRLRIG